VDSVGETVEMGTAQEEELAMDIAEVSVAVAPGEDPPVPVTMESLLRAINYVKPTR